MDLDWLDEENKLLLRPIRGFRAGLPVDGGLLPGGISKRTSMSTSCFDRLATRIQEGRILGKHFCTVNWEFMPVDTAPSSLITQILELDG